VYPRGRRRSVPVRSARRRSSPLRAVHGVGRPVLRQAWAVWIRRWPSWGLRSRRSAGVLAAGRPALLAGRERPTSSRCVSWDHPATRDPPARRRLFSIHIAGGRGGRKKKPSIVTRGVGGRGGVGRGPGIGGLPAPGGDLVLRVGSPSFLGPDCCPSSLTMRRTTIPAGAPILVRHSGAEPSAIPPETWPPPLAVPSAGTAAAAQHPGGLPRRPVP